jgi:hypothetical protein
MKLDSLRQIIKEELKRTLSENKIDIFSSIKKGETVKYMGEDHKVIKKEEATATLESVKTGKTKTLNSSQINEKVRRAKDYLNEADWFDRLSDHPANEPDDDYKQGYRPKSFPYKILANTGESAIFEKDGKLYYFNYDGLDKDDFEDYADVPRIDMGPDEDGFPDYEYGDWDIDEEVVSNYLNDNYSQLSTGYGLEGYEEGKDFIEIDQSLKNEILSIFNDNKVKAALDKLKTSTNENQSGNFNSFIESYTNYLKNISREEMFDESGNYNSTLKGYHDTLKQYAKSGTEEEQLKANFLLGFM